MKSYPELKIIARTDLPVVKISDPITVVMNMRARSLIGSQHNFFHTLARACAVKSDDFNQTYRDIFEIYHPMAEGVFDKKKTEGGECEFAGLVKEMENHLAGRTVGSDAFLPFLTPDLQSRLVDALDTVGGTTRTARSTMFGRYLSAGTKGKQQSFAVIVDALDSNGVAPESMISVLQDDAVGIKIQSLPLPKKRRKQQQQVVDLGITLKVSKGSLLEGITFNGIPVLKVLGEPKVNEDGATEYRVELNPVWLRNSKKVVFTVLFPEAKKVPGSGGGHRTIDFPGLNTRMFCPIFRMGSKGVEMVRLNLWFSEMVAAGIESFAGRRMYTINQDRLQAHMDRHIRKAIRELVIVGNEDPNAAMREALVRMSEYRVQVAGGSISEELAQYQEILTLLKDTGVDIATTSKNKPGTIVTKAWKHGMPNCSSVGIPRFVFSVNPFANFLDMKRRVEVREIRKALPLFNPIPVPVKCVGAGVPAVFAEVLTTLNTVALDLLELNNFIGSDGKLFCFDTVLVTTAGIEKLRLKQLKFQARDGEERYRIVEKLKREGFSESDIKIQEEVESLGNGMSHVVYDIMVVPKEGVLDIGKIKAAVGPIKGVMNPVPFRLFWVNPNGSRTEIDVIVPHDTIVRKHAVDWMKYTNAAKVGVNKIDVDVDPRDVDDEVTAALIDQGYSEDGKQQIIAVLESGEEVDLGMALCGPTPFFRPVQTGRSTSDIKTGTRGIKCKYHSMIMSGGVTFENTPAYLSGDFAEVVKVRKAVKGLLANLKESKNVREEMIAEYDDSDVPVECGASYDYSD